MQREIQLSVTVVGTYTFTLVFKNGAKAVVHVHGATSLEQGRTHASLVWPHVAYTVVDGDETHGHTEPFHAWTNAAAQVAFPLKQARERMQIHRLKPGRRPCEWRAPANRRRR